MSINQIKVHFEGTQERATPKWWTDLRVDSLLLWLSLRHSRSGPWWRPVLYNLPKVERRLVPGVFPEGKPWQNLRWGDLALEWGDSVPGAERGGCWGRGLPPVPAAGAHARPGGFRKLLGLHRRRLVLLSLRGSRGRAAWQGSAHFTQTPWPSWHLILFGGAEVASYSPPPPASFSHPHLPRVAESSG